MQDMYQTSIYKVTIDQGKNQSVKITAVDKNTFEIFESQLVTLQRISSMAISAAFKQSNPQIQYSFSREGDVLALQVVLKMDFLLPVSEIIQLSKIKQNFQYKYLVNDLKKDLISLQKEIEKLSSQNYKLHQIGSYSFQSGGSIFKTSLNQGHFLIELSGLVSSDYQNYDSGQHYDYNYDYLQNKMTFGINVKAIEGNEHQSETIFESNYQMRGFNQSSYQTPFIIKFTLTVKKAGQLNIDQDLSINKYIRLNNILFTMTRLQ